VRDGGISLAAALLVNLTGMAGVALVVAAAPRFQRPSLRARLEPFLPGHRSSTPGRRYRSGGYARGGLGGLGWLLWPAAERAAAVAERWLGGAAPTARRLRAAGSETDPVAFRAEQLLWGLAGFILGVVAGGALGRGGAAPAALALPVAGAVAGALARDWWLGRTIARRHARMLAEFPALVDLLCLAVTAGEAPVAALSRVVRGAGGELRDEFAGVLDDMQAGRSFVGACEQLAVRVPLPEVRRFADALVIAVDRGTPLAAVLRAQAADVRERRKRQLIETGSRREVYMLVPVVVLILPVIVLFVLYPGLLLVRAW
jgi:tight adherence protein C